MMWMITGAREAVRIHRVCRARSSKVCGGLLVSRYEAIFTEADVHTCIRCVCRYLEIAQEVRGLIVDGVQFINDQYKSGQSILIEGANAAMLDVDFGTYPMVTSSSTTIGGAATGLGLYVCNGSEFMSNC
jgi:adenylosuccinate synthase